jgi:signal transduction histidine kinase
MNQTLTDITKYKLALLVLLTILIPNLFFAQISTTVDSTKNSGQKIYFGFQTRHKSKELEPFYKELKNSKYGAQRFSVIDQLIAHHTKKNSTDSVLYYSNLYIKEIRNWDQTEHIKTRYFSKAHYYLGNGNLMNGLTDNAIKWYLEGLQEAEKTNYSEFNYKNIIGLSNAYIQQLNTDKAIPILNNALTEFAPEFPSLKIKNFILLGKAYRLKNDLIKTKSYFDKAMEIAIALADEELQLSIRLELAILAEVNKDYKKAFDGYENTRNEAKEKGFDAVYFKGSLLLAKYHYNREMYDIAIIGLSMAYINAVDRDNLEYQKEMLLIQSKCFARKDDYKNSYAIMTQLYNVERQIKEKQQRAIIKELEVQYETIEKEKAITSLKEDQLLKEAELSRQKTIKNAFLIGFLIILIPIIALLVVYYQKLQTQSELTKKQEEINTQKVQSLIQEQELNLIKASIEGQDEERKRIAQELHDSIGGNLAGIKLQLSSISAGSETLKNINGQIDETYQLVRDISHTLIPKKFKQNAFTDLVEEYTNSISRTSPLNISFHPHPKETINKIDERIQVELFKILQELTTNALKHAQASKIDVHLNLFEDELSLLFEDNGKGFETSKLVEGIGLSNIKSRINNLNGNLHIDSFENRGTVITIDIPDIKKITNEV